MARHNDEEFTNKLKQTIRSSLEKQLRTGIAEGMYALSKMIMDKIGESGLTDEQKLDAIVKLCQPAIDSYAAHKAEREKAKESRA